MLDGNDDSTWGYREENDAPDDCTLSSSALRLILRKIQSFETSHFYCYSSSTELLTDGRYKLLD
jgi:hypothetical protein